MKKLRLLILFGWIALLLTACNTDVELCDELHHPHYAQVEYRFFWGTNNNEQREDSMLVIATRVINQWKSSVRVSSTGNPSRGTYLWNAPEEYPEEVEEPQTPEEPETPEDPDNPETPGDSETPETPGDSETPDDPDTPSATRADGDAPADDITRFKLRSGDYKFITFNRSDEEIDYTNIDRYMRDDNVPMTDLNLVYKSYAKGDERLKVVVDDWTDYNAYSNYMQPSPRPVYYDTLSVRSMRSNGLYYVSFDHLSRLTQHIAIQFDIQKTTGTQPFTIDAVYMEMSGIPYIINLSTGYIDITQTKKVMFKAEHPKDTEDNSRLHCNVSMDVPTIVNNASDNQYTGPGIVQVMICCSAKDPDDPTKTRSKKFQGIINLHNTLQRAQLIKITEDGQHAYRAVDEAILYINAVMEVNGEKVIESTDDNGGLDVWKSVGSAIIVDI